MVKKIILALLLCQVSFSQQILDLKDRASLIEKIQKDRLENLLPKVMSKNGIDMWIIITREYNEDPIIKTLLPPTWLNARRRTILVFTYNEKTKKTVGLMMLEVFDTLDQSASSTKLYNEFFFCLFEF